jgi:hypothetical protein
LVNELIVISGDVTAVIFLVAINEYDMVLEEDNKTNRMEESLKLFSKLTGSQWFDEVSFILFLNKTDLFRVCRSLIISNVLGKDTSKTTHRLF